MRIISRVTDQRIKAENVFIETTVKEYLEFAQEIINNNQLQRKRVKSSNTVYSLLKEDLRVGCILPSIVLALGNGINTESHFVDMTDNETLKYINDNKTNFIILDGLQRTFTMLDVEKEIQNENYINEQFYNNKIRLEIYLGINKFGILYRMLTLNTGQTPMSIRHQIEMLYKEYLPEQLEGIELITEVDDEAVNRIGAYKFKDVIEGFNSYLSRDELPMDRFDILDNVRGLEKLAQENQQDDIFVQFLEVYNEFIRKVDELTEGQSIDVLQEDLGYALDIDGQPFGKYAYKVFNKSQALTGFGAAIGKLKDFKIINSFNDIKHEIVSITYNGENGEWLLELLAKLDLIRKNSKKIGNSQRVYFQFIFRELFNRDSDSFLNLTLAVNNGYHKYRSQME
ncbi:hypothetical protein ACSU64_04380 [Bacillaceae bacterium C204]|uniref:hypothetical protein n=1 Tax=Neobacillus sp. 204 TaxID=3383351 RepID=UPI0039781C2F